VRIGAGSKNPLSIAAPPGAFAVALPDLGLPVGQALFASALKFEIHRMINRM
jgi:hypothetical protein